MDKEKLKGYWEKVKTALGKVSKKIWVLLAVVLVVIAAVAIYAYNNRPYAVLIDGANTEETATVVSWLADQGVTDYRMQGSGTILVPEPQAATLKARLLQEQYSSSGASPSGYFERVGALSTQFDRDQAKLEALQERLEKTIRQFPGVRSVTVNINTGEDRGYVLDANNVVEASASVHLTMESGKMLDSGQVAAIRNYVSHSVASLKVENVSVTDSIGNTYSDFGGGNSQSDSLLKLQLEEMIANRLRTQIMQLLAKGCGGEENVTIGVTPTVELGNKTVNKHEVTLPESMAGNGDGRGILGSEFYAYEFVTPDGYSTGGVVGTSSNADLPTYVEPGQAQAELEGILKEEANRIYDNTTVDTEMIVYCGTLTDLSVAVWINGKAAPVDVEVMRSQIASATNIPPTVLDQTTGQEVRNWKLSVINEPFAEIVEPTPEPPVTNTTIFGIPYWVLIAAGVGLLLFIIILVVVILLVRRRSRKKKEAEQKALEELLATAKPGETVEIEIGPDGEPVIPPPTQSEPVLDAEGNPVGGANVMDLHTERSMELRQNIRDFVDENMEVAALLIKSWLKEDGENG